MQSVTPRRQSLRASRLQLQYLQPPRSSDPSPLQSRTLLLIPESTSSRLQINCNSAASSTLQIHETLWVSSSAPQWYSSSPVLLSTRSPALPVRSCERYAISSKNTQASCWVPNFRSTAALSISARRIHFVSSQRQVSSPFWLLSQLASASA